LENPPSFAWGGGTLAGVGLDGGRVSGGGASLSRDDSVGREGIAKRIEPAPPTQLNLKTAVEEGFRARKWPSHPGKEAFLDEF